MRVPKASLANLPSGDTCAGPGKADEEVHTINSCCWVVLNSQVNVLVDTEAEVSGLAEVLCEELIFLNFEATLDNFESLLSSDGNVDGDLFVTTDSE